MPVVYEDWISRAMVRENRSKLFLFGDNDLRTGFGGQAKEMRGEKNAVGVRTKHAPGRNARDYWTDATFDQNCAKLDEDFAPVVRWLKLGGTVVIPKDGLGTGLSEMPKRCPRTFEYLETFVKALETVERAVVNP